ncbi:hypothetical protein ACLB2K_062854 [Fragaria x ananassa]
MEEGMSGMEAQMDDLRQKVEGLEAEDATIHTAIKDMVVQLEDLWGEMKELNSTLACIEEMHGDLALCKCALVTGAGTSGIVEAKRIEVPKPKSFGGLRNAHEVDNFLWGLDQYFGVIGITEEDAKIKTVALYLTNIAMLWWKIRRGDVEKWRCAQGMQYAGLSHQVQPIRKQYTGPSHQDPPGVFYHQDVAKSQTTVAHDLRLQPSLGDDPTGAEPNQRVLRWVAMPNLLCKRIALLKYMILDSKADREKLTLRDGRDDSLRGGCEDGCRDGNPGTGQTK